MTKQSADTRTAKNTDRPITKFGKLLDEHIRAGYQFMYVATSEENRIEQEIHHIGHTLNLPVITWDCFEGFDTRAINIEIKDKKKYINPQAALEALEGKVPFNQNYIFIFRDMDDFFVDAGVRRRIRTLAEGNRLVSDEQRRPVIFLSARMGIHEKLRSNITVLDYSLPDEKDFSQLLSFLQRSIQTKDQTRVNIDDELRRKLSVNLLGLTFQEAENCISRCLIRHSGFKEEMLTTVKEEKASIVRKGEVLTYIPESSVTSLDDIGGWDLYREWLERRSLAYRPEAQQHRIDYPKGCTIIGLPGTGKSVVAKATSRILGLPAYILDIGSLFGSLVGESEQRTRDVLRQIDAQQGCVLVIDEADKALGDAHSSRGDSGVTRRVFGTILTWLAENKSKTFTIMTLNRAEGLPPELLRAGRFDAMFYTDLPNAEERRQILEIHLRKRGVNIAEMNLSEGDWEEILKKTEGYVGSELEVGVVEARLLVFQETNCAESTPKFDHMMEALNGIVPMTRQDENGMKNIQDYCQGKAKPVTTPGKFKPKARTRNVSVDN